MKHSSKHKTFHALNFSCIQRLLLLFTALSLLLPQRHFPTASLIDNSYYALLQVSPDVDDRQLKRAYRKQALVWHPDRHPHSSSAATGADNDDSIDPKADPQQVFTRLSHAYEVLSNPILRQRYDWLLSLGQVEYDPHRDYSLFDAEHRIEADATVRAFTFADAQRNYERLQREDLQEKVMFSAALILAAICAVAPSLYFVYKQRQLKGVQAKRTDSAKQQLRQHQQLITEYHADKEREEMEQKQQLKMERELRRDEMKRRRVKEIKEQQEIAKAKRQEMESEKHNDENSRDADTNSNQRPTDNSSLLDTQLRQQQANGESAEAVERAAAVAQPTESSDESLDTNDEFESKNKHSDNQAVFNCQPCKKTFKSEAQLHNHQQSKQHQKTVHLQQRQKQIRQRS